MGSGVFCLYSKDKATNFSAYIVFNNDGNNFESLNNKSKLLENTEADGINWILKNATISMSIKYLSNFLRPIKMPLINCESD